MITSYVLPLVPFLTIQTSDPPWPYHRGCHTNQLLQLQHFPVPHALTYLAEDMDDAIAGRDVTDNYSCILNDQYLHKNQREKQKD